MLCRFRNCNKEATCEIWYHLYEDRNILCGHHRELLTILREYYHNSSSKNEELRIRRMCLYLYCTSYIDYNHCARAEVKICKYCHLIDYIDFPIHNVNENNICETCTIQKNELEEKYKEYIYGWNALGKIEYQNGKWKYIEYPQ